VQGGGFIDLGDSSGSIAEIHYDMPSLATINPLSMPEKIDHFQRYHKLIQSATLEMGGKRYKITKDTDKTRQDKTRPDKITEIN
jgi:hypothetical protein